MQANQAKRRTRPNRLRSSLAAVAAVAVGAVAGCTSSGTGQPPTPVTSTRTVVHTRPAPVDSWRPAPAATVRPLPPGDAPRSGERDGSCPYIRAGLDVGGGGGVNLADLEGDRVYRTTVLTRFHPVGCRFYFYARPYEAIADIRPYRFGTPVAAFDAMVRTARTGHELITEKGFVRGLTGICFRTRYFGPDGQRDWAFVFTKGSTMVVVYTQRSDTSRNALYIARAIAPKF